MKLRRFVPITIACTGGIALGVYLGRGPLASSSSSSSDQDLLVWQTPGSILGGTPAGGGGSAKGNAGSKNGASPSGAVGFKGSPMADALLGVINNPNGKEAVNRFYQLLGKMPSKDLAEMIANIDSYPNHSRRRETREMIIDYLTMADPMKALEVRDQVPNKGIFGKAFKQLGRTDPAAALLLRDSIEDSGDKSSALLSIFVGASEVDPARAFELLKATADVGPQHYHEVFDNWAEMDPTTAAKMALTVEKPAERREALKIVGQEWAERDPQAVLDWIGKTELSSYETEIIRKSAINAYARRDAPAAMAMLADMDPAVRNRALPDAFRELVRQDSDAAIAWIREEPDGFAKLRTINESGYSLAREAPEATIELSREIPEIKDRALASAFGRLASTDLDLALKKAQEWQDDPVYSNILSNIASGYGRENPEGALKWAMGLDDQSRSSAVSSVINNLASNDPILAVKHLDGLNIAQDDPIYQNAIQNVASNWAREDPVTAAEWIGTLPDSDTRNQAIGQIADRWTRIDPVSASEWIGSLPEGAGRDQAASQLVRRISNEDPEMAAAWATTISDEGQRNSALSNVYGQWMRVDPAGAGAAIPNSGLPVEMQQRFLQRLQPTESLSLGNDAAAFGR